MGKPGNLPTDNISTLKHMLPKKQADPPLWDMCCPDRLPPNKKWHRRSNLFLLIFVVTGIPKCLPNTSMIDNDCKHTLADNPS